MTNVADVPPALLGELELDFRGPLRQLWPMYDAIRADKRRVIWVPNTASGGYGLEGAGVWMLTRSEDIRKVLQTPDVFSNNTHGDTFMKLIPISLDPPEHTKYRHLMTPMFAPPVVARMEPEIRQLAVSLIDAIKPKGSCEFVEDLAAEFPTRVFTKWIGLPDEQTATFVALNFTLLRGTDEERGAAMASVGEALGNLAADRIASPTGDLMSQIASQEIDGRRLASDELLSIAFLFFLAGLDTVTAALSHSYWHLAQAPDDRKALADQRIEPAKAVEELLRAHSFVNLFRLVTRDVEFAGVQLKRGDKVMLSLPVASRDPDEFEDPTSVHLDRNENRHYAFGAGPHRCLGSHLARLEMRIWLEEWHKRIPDYELDGDAECSGSVVMGVKSLPLRWS